jgi:acetyl-CoA synthetase
MNTADQKKGMTSLSHETRKFPPPKELAAKAHISGIDRYNEMYKRSIEDPEGFWSEVASEEVEWFEKWNKVSQYDFKEAKIEWFIGGKLNVSYNCLDRHAKGERKDKPAIIWQGEPLEESKTYTYEQLYTEVCKFANVLKERGIKKGDRVAIYLPMIPELAIAMLACTRIGAIHSIVFGGFSAEALRYRILDST